MSTGAPHEDAKTAFARERRRRALSRIVSRLRSGPDDVSFMLPFDEVVAALGRTGERDLGVHLIALESIVGRVDRGGEFDRDFRPSADVRARWERIAAARPRRGDAPDRRLSHRRGATAGRRRGHDGPPDPQGDALRAR
jgi:hypothetical protein